MVSTRRRNYDCEDSSDGQGVLEHSITGPHLRPETLFDRQKRWAILLRMQHYQALITEVLERELPKYATGNILPAPGLNTVRECIQILASAPSVFAAAVDGTLSHRMLTHAPLQREYSIVQARATNQPSIYIHLLADDKGVAPTANQYMVIRDAILRYMNVIDPDEEMAWLVDNITRPLIRRTATASGYRKYLWTLSRSPRHLETLQRLCEGIQRRWTETPSSERDEHFAFPPGECGYSVNSHTRIAQHRQRHSSNYVMNLVEDICSYLYTWDVFKQNFRMHPYIIYLIFNPQQAAIAEIFCSGLLQVWVDEGGGLNGYPAGRSVASATRISVGEWAENEMWVVNNTPLKENLKVQKGRLETDVLGLEKEMEDLWRDALGGHGGVKP